MNGKGVKLRVILLSLVIIILIVAIYFSFFYYHSCADEECFKSRQRECARTRFTLENEYASWFYEIKGESSDNCEILARVVEIKQGTIDKTSLENKDMVCSLPVGSLADPEEDLSLCHGLLKEEIQHILIDSAHAQIIANIGEIEDELEDIM